MADTKTNTEDAARELGTGAPAATIDGAFGPNWQAWQEHIVAHVPAPDEDNDGVAEMGDPVVPLLAYGDGPNDYIATDFDAGQVVVRDGNDRTGKAWKWPISDFMRFVAHAHGKRLPDEPKEEGDGPYEAARKLAARTAKLIQADRDAEAGREGADSKAKGRK
jgi:hypothetical protein